MTVIIIIGVVIGVAGVFLAGYNIGFDRGVIKCTGMLLDHTIKEINERLKAGDA